MSVFYRLVLFSFVVIIGFSGCSSEDGGSLELNFKLKYDDQTLVMFDKHQYPDSFDLFFTRFSFFLSNINLSQGNTNFALSEIEMINPTASHQELTSAQDGYTVRFDDILVMDYDKLDFSVGVPADLNAMAPADFETNHPLASSGEYWLGWESYVFLKVEGKIDFDGDGEFEEGMSLHIGSDVVFKNTSISGDFSILKDETTSVDIIIDLMDVFESNGTMYDLEGTPRIHSLEQISQADQLATNFAQAIND